MDKLSGLASKLGGGSSNKQSNTGSSGSAGQEDYLDKGEFTPIFIRRGLTRKKKQQQ